MTLEPTSRWLDADSVIERIAAAAVSIEQAAVVRRQLAACADTMERVGAGPLAGARAFQVPGRIEVLGKHTDYAGGRSLLAASEQGLTILAVPRADREVRVHAVASGETVRCSLDPGLGPAAGWANYPVTVVRRLTSNFPDAQTGADVAFIGDIPIAAGMSSSSALVVGVFSVLAAINRLEEGERYRANLSTREELAGYLAAMENGYGFGGLPGEPGVGTLGGSEDHTAMLCASPTQVVRYAFAPVRFEQAIPMPAGHCFVVASSGVAAEKAGAARASYNRAAELMHAAAELWNAEAGGSEGTIGESLDADPSAAARLLHTLAHGRHERFSADDLVARAQQFITENTSIIPAASAALSCGNLTEFGRLVDHSQELAERLLRNQIPETSFLARSAREAGAVAASAFGAGFGGSVWAMLPEGMAVEFEVRWRTAYLARFPEHEGAARFMHTRAGGAMARLI